MAANEQTRKIEMSRTISRLLAEAHYLDLKATARALDLAEFAISLESGPDDPTEAAESRHLLN